MAEHDLIRLTAELVSAHAEGNKVATSDLPDLIRSVHDALARLGQEDVSGPEVPVPTREAGAVSARKSLASPDKIISMIDGKPYSTLKKHIARHGFTPETYRERFGLKLDYPMVAPTYSEMRKGMAKMIGLGRKVVGAAAASAAGAAGVALADALIPASVGIGKAARKPRADKAAPAATDAPMALVDTARDGTPTVADAEPAPAAAKRRGRPPRITADAGSASSGGTKLAADDEFFDSAKAPKQ